MRKLRLNTAFILSLCLLFACSEGDGVLDHLDQKGKVKFNLKEDPREPIELTNARANKIQKGPGYWLEVKKGGEVVLDDVDVRNVGEVELEPGQYTATLTVYDQSEKYKDRISAQGSDDFTVKAGETTTVDLVAFYNTTTVMVSLPDKMADAVVWGGEEGFTPDDSYLLNVIGGGDYLGYFYADEKFDIVVEWNGQIKRFTANAGSPEYEITIVDNETEEPEIGKALFSWQMQDYLIQQIEFEW